MICWEKSPVAAIITEKSYRELLQQNQVHPIVGACVIASWAYGLIRDTGAILLDRVPDQRLAGAIRATIESDGSTLSDLHLWRLGPGHLGAILSVRPRESRTARYFRQKIAHFRSLSHVTIEIDDRSNDLR